MFDGPILIKSYQIIVWVSLGLKGAETLGPETPRFPAIVDTGSNHNFAIRQEHLENWAGMSLSATPTIGHVFMGLQRLPLNSANIWIHPNKCGKRDLFSSQPAFPLELDNGVVVYPKGVPNIARLPLEASKMQ